MDKVINQLVQNVVDDAHWPKRVPNIGIIS